MAKDVMIIGAGGHAKVIADIVLRAGDNLIGFLDDSKEKQGAVVYKDYRVLGKLADVFKYPESFFVVAIGDNKTRAEVVSACTDIKWYTAVHPAAVVADSVSLGEGSVVMAGAVVNPDTIVGKHCIINTLSSLDHDNKIGDFVHVSPGAHLAGEVVVGNGSWICTGATVINRVSIAGNVVIGAGAAVLEDINEPGVYVGTPARRIK